MNVVSLTTHTNFLTLLLQTRVPRSYAHRNTHNNSYFGFTSSTNSAKHRYLAKRGRTGKFFKTFHTLKKYDSIQNSQLDKLDKGWQHVTV